MYDRMIREHGYSIRKLAEKLGKDKGYLENRLRLADAPPEIRELVSLRKDTLSHAYELMKVEDPQKRRRLAEQVARNELSLVKLRERIEGRPARTGGRRRGGRGCARAGRPVIDADEAEAADWSQNRGQAEPIRDDSLVAAKQQLTSRRGPARRPPQPGGPGAIGPVDRTNLAKYLTIAKLRLENAIAVVRTGDADR